MEWYVKEQTHLLWHENTHRQCKGISELRYHAPQVDLAIYAMRNSQTVPSLWFYHIIFIQVKDIDKHDAQNDWSNKIAIDEKYNLWQSPSKPAKWGVRALLEALIAFDERPDPLHLIMQNVINIQTKGRNLTSLSIVITWSYSTII